MNGRSSPHLHWRIITLALALALVLPAVLPTSSVQAEGSRELTDSGGQRPYNEYRGPIDGANGQFLVTPGIPSTLNYYYPPSTAGTRTIDQDLEPDNGSGFLSFSESVTGDNQRRTLVYVYAEVGEYIMLGSSSVGEGVNASGDTDCAQTDVFCGMIGFVPPGGNLIDMRFFDPVTAANVAYPANTTNFPDFNPANPAPYNNYPQLGEPCGKIETYNEEIGVANMNAFGTSLPFPTGYNACIIHVDGTNNPAGVYEIHFITPSRFQTDQGIANPPSIDADGADAEWEDTNNFISDSSVGRNNPVRGGIPADTSGEPRYDVAYNTAWEVQVLRAGADPFFYDYAPDGFGPPIGPGDGNDVEFGRVWINYFAINMGQNDRQMSSKMFVYTDTGARYFYDANGIDPFGFLLFSNNKGNVDTGGDGNVDVGDESVFRTIQFIGNNLGQRFPDAATPSGAGVLNDYGVHPPTGFDPDEWQIGDPADVSRNITNKFFLRQIDETGSATMPAAAGPLGSVFFGTSAPFFTNTWANIDYEEPDLPGNLNVNTLPLDWGDPCATNDFADCDGNTAPFLPTIEPMVACSTAPTCPTFPTDALGPDYTSGNKPVFIYRPKDDDGIAGTPDGSPGGYFFFTNVDNEGLIKSYRVLLDLNTDGDFDDDVDRILIGDIQGSTVDGEQIVNVVEWDGLNGLGNVVGELDEFSAELVFQAGEVHFPYFDAEAFDGAGTGTFIHRLRPIIADDAGLSSQRYPAVLDRTLVPRYANYTTLYYDNRYNWTSSSTPGTYDFSPCYVEDFVAGNENTETWTTTYNVSSDLPGAGSSGGANDRCQGTQPTNRTNGTVGGGPLTGTFPNPRFSLASEYGVPGNATTDGSSAAAVPAAVNTEPGLGVLQFTGTGGAGAGNRRGIDLWTTTNYRIANLPTIPTSVSLLGFDATPNTVDNALPGVAATGLAMLALLGGALALRLRRRTAR